MSKDELHLWQMKEKVRTFSHEETPLVTMFALHGEIPLTLEHSPISFPPCAGAFFKSYYIGLRWVYFGFHWRQEGSAASGYRAEKGREAFGTVSG